MKGKTINQDTKAIAQQKLQNMESCTVDEVLTLVWGRDMSMYVQNEQEKLKLIRKGIRNMQYQYDVTRAGLRRAQTEIERLRCKPELFS